MPNRIGDDVAFCKACKTWKKADRFDRLNKRYLKSFCKECLKDQILCPRCGQWRPRKYCTPLKRLNETAILHGHKTKLVCEDCKPERRKRRSYNGYVPCKNPYDNPNCKGNIHQTKNLWDSHRDIGGGFCPSCYRQKQYRKAKLTRQQKQG